MDKSRVEKRLAVMVLLLVLFFFGLGGRLVYLQVVQAAYFSEISRQNRIRILPMTAPRGNIYDRYGQLLAANRACFAVSLMPLDDEVTDGTITELASILGIAEDEIRAKIEKHKNRPFEPVRIVTDISQELHTRIVENRDRLPGVMIETLPVREYVHGPLAAHLLGYVSEISPSELEAMAWSDYEAGDVIGKAGLERRYDKELRGVDGGQQVEVDSTGHPVKVLGEIPAEMGHGLVLTIDAELQRVAEEFYDKWTERVRKGEGFAEVFPEANAGACVVMKVDTGEVLAMFSRPTYDPTVFATGVDAAVWRALSSDPLVPLYDRVLRGRYTPGSTFKMVTASAALEAGRTDRSFRVYDSGFYPYGNVVFKCWKQGGHGSVDIVAALKHSCNTYFYEMAVKLGPKPDALIDWAERYGLGVLSGIDLAVPGETAEADGIIAGRDYGGSTWQGGQTLQAAIGQGHAFTPIQMAVYASALANGGTRYVPQVVKRVVSPEGDVLWEMEPEVAGTAGASDDTLALIREGMVACATEITGPAGPGTSAWLFYNFPITVAGKTGTATAPPGDDHAWYVAYAPAEDPEIAVVVLVERGGHGSTAAAPVAKAIFEQYFGLNQGARPRPPSELPATSGGD
ncbi:MAG: penicillin-binding protein 2 [Bacillota bacterium]|nr:MAG: penicillin-binding protein 2 [Bacillota bacterium]